MLHQLQHIFSSRIKKTIIPVNKTEQNELLYHVLKHSLHIIERYSIDDPKIRYTDLMLAPTLIEEAIEMLNSKGIKKTGLLADYLPSLFKKG